MNSLAAKRTEENESKKPRTCVFEADNQACTGRITFCYSLTSWTTELWPVTLSGHAWVDRDWIESCVPAVRKFVTKTVWYFASRQCTVRRRQYDRLSQQQLSFLFLYCLVQVTDDWMVFSELDSSRSSHCTKWNAMHIFKINVPKKFGVYSPSSEPTPGRLTEESDRDSVYALVPQKFQPC